MQKYYQLFSRKPYKPLYNLFVPRSIRKQWHYQYDEIPRQNQMAAFWEKAIALYQQGQIPHYPLAAKQPELVGKKIIWQYWGQGFEQLPEVARICFASIDRHKTDYQIIRLTDETIAHFLDLPDFVWVKKNQGDFRPAYFSDILRTALIQCYGGVWLDASVLLLDDLPRQYSEYDFFVFSRAENSHYKHWGNGNAHCYFNWNPEFQVNYLNSIIYGKPNNNITPIILDLLLYFWQTQQQVNHYFFYQILLNQLNKNHLVDFNFPVIDDALPHLLQHVIQKPVDVAELNRISAASPLQKLSLHYTPNKTTLTGARSFYGHLYTEYAVSIGSG